MISWMRSAIILSVFFIFCLGMLMVYNTTSAEILSRNLNKDLHQSFFKQLVYALACFPLFLLVFRLDYRKIIAAAPFLFVGGCLLLCLVFIPGIGTSIKGAHRWIHFLGFSFQPSECMKFIVPLFVIHQVMNPKTRPETWKRWCAFLAMVLVPILLIFFEPDNGSVAILFATLIVLFFLTKIRWTFWVIPLGILLIAGAGAAWQMKHVPDRIRIYLNPELDLLGRGHQPYQAKIAAGSGGLWGKGLGESFQKLDFLPEARSDYIAAIFAEEFGFAGFLTLLIFYSLIGIAGFYIAFKSPDAVGFYLAGIFTFLICFQTFLNLGVVSGLLPSKGTSLPFFSLGGTSLIIHVMAVGVILNVGRACEQTV